MVENKDLWKEKEPIMPALKKMGIDDVLSFPAERTSTVRSAINQVNMQTGMGFKTKLERPLLYVRRIK